MHKILFVLLILTSSNAMAQEYTYEMIGDYKFEHPNWWKEISICYPDSLSNQAKTSRYLAEHYGSETGDSTNWKTVMKYWVANAKMTGQFPVYIAHCYKDNGQTEEAIKVFEGLYEVIADDELSDWYHCYLAYNLGKAYALLNNIGKATEWYSKGSSDQFLNSKEGAISYYAGRCKKWLDEHQPENPTKE